MVPEFHGAVDGYLHLLYHLICDFKGSVILVDLAMLLRFLAVPIQMSTLGYFGSWGSLFFLPMVSDILANVFR